MLQNSLNNKLVSGAFTVTSGGHKFRLDTPDSNCYTISDIGQALAKLCRFNGHTNRFYSVAEHCVHMSKLVPEQYALEALMHDAVEAYIGDFPKPVKVAIPLISELEDLVMEAIFDQFSLTFPLPEEVHEVDKRMIPTEAPQLLDHYSGKVWGMEGVKPYALVLPCWRWEEAHVKFMERYAELTGDYEKAA